MTKNIKAQFSDKIKNNKPSAIRLGQMAFSDRKDNQEIIAVNAAIGNIDLPTHPKIIYALHNLCELDDD
ncbi:MAG: hypothetical protein Q9M91_02330 [Candidatus Dojkabacteria bacterium]|nr:hypothetical protein [Candidatus Dojkabacteria bacterium]MDQ7020662.1 hypothetical protein [Candidatus Dojkabacteria bacterium]